MRQEPVSSKSTVVLTRERCMSIDEERRLAAIGGICCCTPTVTFCVVAIGYILTSRDPVTKSGICVRQTAAMETRCSDFTSKEECEMERVGAASNGGCQWIPDKTSYGTTLPTTLPTSIPSTCPSISPSTFPTIFPSTSPSTFPSSAPTIPPSTIPTSSPSLTLAPTVLSSQFWRITSSDYLNPWSIVEIKFNELTSADGICFSNADMPDNDTSCSLALDGNVGSDSRWISPHLSSEASPNFFAFDFITPVSIDSISFVPYIEINRVYSDSNIISLQYSHDGQDWIQTSTHCIPTVKPGLLEWATLWRGQSKRCETQELQIKDWDIESQVSLTSIILTPILCICFFAACALKCLHSSKESLAFQWKFFCVLWFTESWEVTSMIWSLVEQRGCPLSTLLVIGLELQFFTIFLFCYITPFFHDAWDPETVKKFHYFIVFLDVVTLMCIAIPAVKCGNIEDGAAAISSLAAAVTSFFGDVSMVGELYKPVDLKSNIDINQLSSQINPSWFDMQRESPTETECSATTSNCWTE